MIFVTKEAMKKIYIILITLALIAATVFFHHRKENRENIEMEHFATLIADETDHDFENATTDIIEKIKTDDLFNSWVNDDNLPSDDSILSYLDSKYFNDDLFNYYNKTLIVCDSSSIIVQYDMGVYCEGIYKSVLEESIRINENLYRYDDSTSDIYYIVKVKLNDWQNLYIEFYKQKVFNKFSIYADSTKIQNLLIPNLKNYSIAIYNNDILNYKFGNYLFPNNINNFIAQEDGIHKGENYKHLILNDLENHKTVVVTIEAVRWLRYIMPFSIIFIVILLAYFLYSYLKNGRKSIFKHSFHGKMQLMIFAILAVSFFAIGLVSYLFLKNNVTKKTQISQYKQANIIRNNIEKKLPEKGLYDVLMLWELSDSFFCDINIYDDNGLLINSSMDVIMFGDTINKAAYRNIVDEEAGYFVQTEYYKGEKNTSYYFPILDENNELAGILNVIYFDFNSEYDDQLSNFVINYINIILVLFGISAVIVIFITRKTLKPLKIIEDQMGKISLDGTNEPIDFKGHDEIGALVQQYNNMCRQLEIAANKLARNERENAWREMARQVAHEIKNPLTPMRLNIEYLQMLWDRKDPKFEENFKETLKSLLEQIETLSKIATAFSDYAKLPENVSTTFDLSELLKSTIKLYDVEKNISISLIYNENDNWSLFADKNNLGRVFGNIIKNGIQAIGSEIGHIEVILNRLGEKYRVQISDNGCGIKEEDKKKVFFPNFTTKSSGMGVGLSVSQNIIQGMGGNISFSSKEGICTVFTIDIPILKEM
ncbi:MAG: hypothetical protein CW336_04760 [Bacteroidetes bacterium]|nr:hypothetical protein [Bacteroidota bacterium]